ncbi:MAG TPA: HAMP domain-containing protein, partial [Ilumatobacteraceae bacterium]|nr:HAMP domain-containing protein [Ilumatobacteraceae bacterium]
MKWRIFAAFAGLLAVTLLAQDIPLASYLRDVEYARTVTALERDAFIIAGSSEDILAGQSAGTLADLETSARMYHANHRHTRVIIVDAQGRLVVNSDGEQPGADYAQSHPGVAAALKGTPTPGRRESGAEGDVVFVAVPVLSGTDVVGAVRISHPWDTVLDDSRSRQSVLVLAFAISMIAALVVSFVMALSLSRPLHRLRRSTERLARGDFTERADESTGPPEFRSLAASFNKMTMQVDQLMRQQRDFAGDASHQLRSPLTALRLRLEQASIDMAELDESEESTRLHVGLTAALAETERLQRLIDGLLMLARAEPT